MKRVQIGSYYWSLFSHIQSECWEIRTRNNSVFGHFSRSENLFVVTLHVLGRKHYFKVELFFRKRASYKQVKQKLHKENISVVKYVFVSL